SPLSKPHVRFSREQTLVAPAGQARCFLFANGRAAVRAVNRIVSGENFWRRRDVGDQISERLWPTVPVAPRSRALRQRDAMLGYVKPRGAGECLAWKADIVDTNRNPWFRGGSFWVKVLRPKRPYPAFVNCCIRLFGTAGWTRTTDLLVHSQAL